MNLYLVLYIDKILEGAMVKFAKFLKHSIFHFDRNGFILEDSKKMIGFYERFFGQVGFLPRGHSYYKGELLTEMDINSNGIPESHSLKKRLASILDFKGLQFSMSKDSVFPVHMHCSTKKEIQLITGVAILERRSTTVRFVLHELGIPKHLIKPTPRQLKYLDKLLEHYINSEQKSVNELLQLIDRNYNQFQKDCKAYYGSTFYEFYTKRRMVNVVGDLMFSSLSLKEISHNNGFSGYESMYKSFTKYEGLALINIPRFLKGE